MAITIPLLRVAALLTLEWLWKNGKSTEEVMRNAAAFRNAGCRSQVI